MFEVESHTDGEYKFGRGGNQGARGNDKGGDWFIENVFEECVKLHAGPIAWVCSCGHG